VAPVDGETAPAEYAQPLRALRAERLLSMRDLARLADVAPSTIYLTEAGRTTPQPAVMRRIATALGVAPHHIAEFRRAVEARARPR
jgi:transcriptional regulator with XRE-family HTH domain